MNAMERTRAAVWVLAVSTVLLGPALRGRAQDGPPHNVNGVAADALGGPPAGPTRVHVADVIIQGNQLLKAERIKAGLKTRPGMEYNRDLVQQDIRELAASKMFGKVEARESYQANGDVIVYFIVSDYQHLVRRVLFEGPKHLSDKELYDLAGIREGTPLSPTHNKLACETIKRKLQEMGRPFASCELRSGDKPGDEEVIFLITEGPKLAIAAIEFTGNTFVSAAVLRTHLASSAKFLGIFGGTYSAMMADQDIVKLLEYYKAFGFLDVRISRELQYHPNGRDLILIFHISEGTRYTVGGPPQWNGVKSIDLTPIQEISKVKPGGYFDQRAIDKDMARAKDYIGYTGREAHVSCLPVYSPANPGIVQVVYDVEEQAPARVGRVIIIGNTRTKQNVVLDALGGLEPGQVLTYPDLKVAERNLARLGIFKSSPDGAIKPAVTVEDNPANPTSPFKDIIVRVEEDNTGSLMFGVGVNSDAGLTGSIVLTERNFDLFRWPTSFDDALSGNAWRGAGQEFRVEAVPGTELQRYTISFREPHLLDTDNSLGVSGYYYERTFNEYTEDRLGTRVTLGRKIGDFLTVSGAVRVEDVNVTSIAYGAPVEYTSVQGENFQVGLKGSVTYDARDSFIRPTQGFLADASFEQMVGDHTFQLVNFEFDQFYTAWQRKDETGRQVLAIRSQVGWASDNTPVYEKYFAGGFRSLRGFQFRGVGPDDGNGFKTGGTFQFLNSIEYQVPILANEQLYAVGFVDSGTVEQGVRITDYRVTAGFGIRFVVPMLGPVPIALDFGFPIVKGPYDNTQVFSFYMGMSR